MRLDIPDREYLDSLATLHTIPLAEVVRRMIAEHRAADALAVESAARETAWGKR